MHRRWNLIPHQLFGKRILVVEPSSNGLKNNTPMCPHTVSITTRRLNPGVKEAISLTLSSGYQKIFNMVIFGKRDGWKWITYRKIQVSFAWHNQTLCLEAGCQRGKLVDPHRVLSETRPQFARYEGESVNHSRPNSGEIQAPSAREEKKQDLDIWTTNQHSNQVELFSIGTYKPSNLYLCSRNHYNLILGERVQDAERFPAHRLTVCPCTVYTSESPYSMLGHFLIVAVVKILRGYQSCLGSLQEAAVTTYRTSNSLSMRVPYHWLCGLVRAEPQITTYLCELSKCLNFPEIRIQTSRRHQDTWLANGTPESEILEFYHNNWWI